MTSRERVLHALAHRPTDRMPADYGALSAVTERLIARLGVADKEEMLRALHVDMRRIKFDHNQPDSPPDADGYKRNMWGVLSREPEPGCAPVKPSDGRPNTIYPFNEDTTVDEVHAHPWPDPAKLDYSAVGPECRQHHGTYATFGAPWSPFFHEIAWLIGQENFFVWMATKPDVVRAILDHVTGYEIEASRRYFDAARGALDIAYFGNDFGTQRGLFISPQMWGEFIRPPLKRFYDLAHSYGIKVMQHSCGDVRAIIPYLIEDGLDVLDPIQVACSGMDLAGLLRDFGDRLCFHGGVDTQQVLPFGSADDVRAVVRSYRVLTKDRGGYILCGSQSFIEDIPLDNVLAMYDENHCAH
jgi:uroporphyrinogen decarboxylase